MILMEQLNELHFANLADVIYSQFANLQMMDVPHRQTDDGMIR